MKKVYLLIFTLFLVIVKTSAETMFFKNFSIGENFSSVNSKIFEISGENLKSVESNFFETDYFRNNFYREKLLCGFDNNTLNLVMEYFLLDNEVEYLDLKEKVEKYLNENYSWNYKNKHQYWEEGEIVIRTFSQKIQMDGKEGYSFWLMYAGNISWDATKYIYEPFRTHKTPYIPDNIPVYWELGTKLSEFSRNHTDCNFIATDRLRKIIKKTDSEIKYVDYLFSKMDGFTLRNIYVKFEFKSREEQKKKFNELVSKYTELYGNGRFRDSYDEDLYQDYLISKSNLITDAMVCISYYARNYVLDQADSDKYLVSVTFMKY